MPMVIETSVGVDRTCARAALQRLRGRRQLEDGETRTVLRLPRRGRADQGRRAAALEEAGRAGAAHRSPSCAGTGTSSTTRPATSAGATAARTRSARRSASPTTSSREPDGKVTVRERDSMPQERIAIGAVPAYLPRAAGGAGVKARRRAQRAGEARPLRRAREGRAGRPPARLLLRRRQGRRRAATEGAAGRQGRQPRGDDAARRAGAARLHDRDATSAPRTRPRAAGSPRRVQREVAAALARVERVMGSALRRPGAAAAASRCAPARRVSMPGMMDTVLNLGLNDATVRGSRAAGRRALRLRQLPPLRPDVRRRRARRAARALRDAPRAPEGAPRRRTSTPSSPPTTGASVMREYLRDRARSTPASAFPQDPQEQLWGAIGAVFRSWDNDRARSATGSMHGDPRRLGHRRQRAGDGVRQHGRRLRHRRRLHARSVDRRERSSTAST